MEKQIIKTRLILSGLIMSIGGFGFFFNLWSTNKYFSMLLNFVSSTKEIERTQTTNTILLIIWIIIGLGGLILTTVGILKRTE